MATGMQTFPRFLAVSIAGKLARPCGEFAVATRSDGRATAFRSMTGPRRAVHRVAIDAPITNGNMTQRRRAAGSASQSERRDSMMRTLIIAAATWAVSATAAFAQDVASGERSFHKCLPCHSIGPGAQNKIGPELNGLDGRRAGTVPGYAYSDANKNSAIVWNEAKFKEYIKDPAAMVPHTKMIFPGVKNEQEVNDLWAYVSQYDADGSIKKK
jgi:cytochrome c